MFHGNLLKLISCHFRMYSVIEKQWYILRIRSWDFGIDYTNGTNGTNGSAEKLLS